MTETDIRLIRASFAKVVPIAPTAAELFYARLFEIAPETKPLFRGDMAEQGRKLMAMLGTVVASLDRLDALVPAAQGLARRHVQYGVEPAHYAPVGEALIDTLARGLGEDFDPDTRASWLVAYGTLSAVMIAAAYPEAA
jgi:hemoglobin-like flavoprotein